MKKMKVLVLSIMAAMMLFAFQPIRANNTTEPVPATLIDPVPANSAEIKVLTERLDEINSMDKTVLSSSEKRDLRKELRSINKEMTHPRALYVSGGSLILIIILLIILL